MQRIRLRHRVRADQLALVTRQMAVMLNAGLDILRTLETLSGTGEDRALRQVMAEIRQEVSKGRYLSQALVNYPEVFSPLYVSMVKVGESTGGLVQALDLLADWMLRADRARRALLAALVYPAFVVALTLLLALVFSATVIPRLAVLLEELSPTLPWLTRATISLSRLLANPWLWLALLVMAANSVAVLHSMASQRQGRERLWRWLRQLPVLGPLLELAALARWCSAAHLLLRCGNNLIASLRLAAQASGSPRLEADSAVIRQALSEGATLSSHLLAEPLYPGMVAQLIGAGERTGRLADMFRRCALLLEAEVTASIEQATLLLEPLLVALVSGLVGLFLISIMMPLSSVVSAL